MLEHSLSEYLYAHTVSRFVDSLSAKVYNEPPTIEALSDLFQEFYVKASSHIATHISALSSRINREASPAPRAMKTALASKSTSLKSQSSGDSLEKSATDQQMLTASEVAQRRKARRMLEIKRLALEEAVEKRACEKIYNKIWRHKNTLDEVRDEKLRSKQAALALVGIGLKDLGIEVGEQAVNGEETVREWLAPARDELALMDQDHYPLGKLRHLEFAHKSIVDTLSRFHPSSSSADEILPTMIFTLITCPPEGINIISNLYFIERFRASNKVDGEAAYCMTNLEAAISFLENVDLSSLREDEAPEGPTKSSSRPTTPLNEKPEPFPSLPPSMPSLSSRPVLGTSDSTASGASLQPPNTGPRSPSHQRRISNPFQQASKVIGTANDAVRNTAEEGFKNISNTLDNSFKFLFGRLQEHNVEKSNGEVVMPKTLDDARRLVSPDPNEAGINSETSSMADLPGDSPDANKSGTKSEDRLLSVIGGRKTSGARDRSADSTQSSGSGRRVAFAPTNPSNLAPSNAGTLAANNPAANAFDSMKNLGNSLNPLSHFSAFGGGLRGLGLKQAVPPPPTAAPGQEKERPKTQSPSTTLIEVPKQVIKEGVHFEPPVQKFLEVQDVRQLTLGDVDELLRDYQRLAMVLGQMATMKGDS